MCVVVIVLGKAVYFFSPLPLSKSRLAVKSKQMHFNWNPLHFLSELSHQKSVTRFPPDVWQAFFCRSFGAPIRGFSMGEGQGIQLQQDFSWYGDCLWMRHPLPSVCAQSCDASLGSG